MPEAQTGATGTATPAAKVRAVKTTDAKLAAITRIKKIVEPLADNEKSIVFRYLYEDYSAFFPSAE